MITTDLGPGIDTDKDSAPGSGILTIRWDCEAWSECDVETWGRSCCTECPTLGVGSYFKTRWN